MKVKGKTDKEKHLQKHSKNEYLNYTKFIL